MKSEHFHESDPEHQKLHQSLFDSKWHGKTGPLQTVYSKQYGAPHQHWHATFHNLGIKTNKSHFSGSNVGVWTAITGVDPVTRERSYSATAYFQPNAQRPNLIVLTEAIARNIVLERNGENWVAKGVKFGHGGKEFVVKTTGEVILCAGSVQSPQLLELSGIGNPEVLEKAGIEVKVNNPSVGENLQEHMSKYPRTLFHPVCNPVHTMRLTG